MWSVVIVLLPNKILSNDKFHVTIRCSESTASLEYLFAFAVSLLLLLLAKKLSTRNAFIYPNLRRLQAFFIVANKYVVKFKGLYSCGRKE